MSTRPMHPATPWSPPSARHPSSKEEVWIPSSAESAAGGGARFGHAEYAWALNRLRRAGVTPTLAAIAQEISQRDQSAEGEKPPVFSRKTESLDERLEPVPVRRRVSFSSPLSSQSSTIGEEPTETAVRPRNFVSAVEIEELREALQREAEEKAALEKQLARRAQQQTVLEEMEREVNRYRTMAQDSKERETTLRLQLEQINHELTALQSEASVVREGRQAELEALKTEQSRARARIAELENQLEEAKVDGVLQQSLEDLIQEQKLSLEATGQRAESLTTLLQEAAAKASRVDGLESSLIALQAEVEAGRERENHLRDSLTKAQQERRDAEAALLSSRESLAEWQSRASAPQGPDPAMLAEQERLTQLAATLQREVAALREENGSQGAAMERLARQLRERDDALAQLRTESSGFREEISRLRAARISLQGKLSREQKQFEESQIATARLEEKLAAAEASRKTAQARADAQEVELLRQEARLKEHAASLARAQADLVSLQEESAASVRLLEKSREDEARLVRELGERDATLAGFAAKETDWVQTRQNWEGRETALQSQISELETLLTTATAEQTALQEQWQATQSTAQSTSLELPRLREQLEQLTGELQRVRQVEAALRKKWEEQEKIAARREEELARNLAGEREALVALRQQFQVLQEELGELQTARATDQEALAEWQSRAREAADELARRQSNEEELARQLTVARQEIGRIEEKFSGAEMEGLAALQQQLTEHREALAEARLQNEHLLERLDISQKRILEGAGRGLPVRPLWSRLVVPLLTGAGLILVLTVAGFMLWKNPPAWLPGLEELRKNAETFEQLKAQNSQLATELNETLNRLQSAKAAELTHAEVRRLTERLQVAEVALADFQREAPAQLARTTKLQSDLDLARSRLERISAELTARDLRILELERLLGEAGAEIFQIPAPPRLSLTAPELTSTLPTLPRLPSPETTASGDLAADALRTLQAQAEEAYRDKNYGLAEVLFQRLVEASPQNALAYSNLAAVQLELSKFAQGKANIRKAIALEPNDAFSQTTQGMILLRTGETEAAIASFLRAIELDPGSADAFHYLGVAYDQSGQRQKAIDEIRKALKISPDYAEAHFNLAVLHSQGGPSERNLAREHYLRALKLGAHPDHDMDLYLK